MLKHFICLTVVLLSGFFSKAQTTEDSVKKVVVNLFKAALDADSAAVMDCFWPEAIVQSITPDKIRFEPAASIASAFGKLKKGQLDERIEFGAVHIDSYLASVWTPYRLYVDGKFIHCGADSFQIVKRKGVWKISHLIDTRRKNCD